MPVERYTILPCGCEPGFFLCREAESLWRDALNLMRDRGRYDNDYLEARRKYDEHTKIVESSMRVIGQKGGSVTSENKVRSSRENGRKGGRPRKMPSPPPPIINTDDL